MSRPSFVYVVLGSQDDDLFVLPEDILKIRLFANFQKILSITTLKRHSTKADKHGVKRTEKDEMKEKMGIIEEEEVDGKSKKPKNQKKSKSKKEPENKKPKNKVFQIYRFSPGDKKPKMDKFTIDLNDCRPMVLDALLKIKKEQDSSLAFRRSCREGVCGSCAMNIDGINRLACIHPIKPGGASKVYPLPHMYVIKDLIVDMSHFFSQMNRIKPYLIRRQRQGKLNQYLQSENERDMIEGYVECIWCACCSTSCPAYWWRSSIANKKDFLGPAAILNAHRWIRDSRDHGLEERLEILAHDHNNVFHCKTIFNCTSVCPKGLNPGKAIAEVKQFLINRRKKPPPEMEGTDRILKKE